MTNRTRKLAALYTTPAPQHDRGRVLAQVMVLSVMVSTGVGLLLLTVDTSTVLAQVQQEARRITFHAPALPVAQPEPLPEPEPPAPEPEPVELAPETVLAQTIDLPEPEPESVPATPDPEPTPRRVYGVRKVLARGLGDAGSGGMRTGLVVKRGNVLDGVADSLTATKDDLKGQLAALSTVERAPEPVHRVKPIYSEALVEARASGTVSARVLVDVDGRVAAVEVTEEFGYDSAVVAEAALRQFRFRPALRRGEPVAVWIIHRIRFEFQE